MGRDLDRGDGPRSDNDLDHDAADEWGLESMQELACLYRVGEESNFIDVAGGSEMGDRWMGASRGIADTILTRTILRYH